MYRGEYWIDMTAITSLLLILSLDFHSANKVKLEKRSGMVACMRENQTRNPEHQTHKQQAPY